MNKPQIIQVVENYGTDDLLKHRIEHNKIVDLFIVVGKIESDLLLSNTEKILLLEIENSNLEILYQSITEKLFEVCVGSNDIVVYSSNEQFCDFSKIDELKEELNYGPFFLKHLNFWWGKNLYEYKKTKGSFVFSFLHLIIDRGLLKRKLENKQTDSFFERYSPENGWAFNGFYNNNSYDSVFKINLNPRDKIFEKLIPFHNNMEIPLFFNELPEFKIEISGKILITIEDDFVSEFHDKTINIFFRYDTIDSLSVSDDYRHLKFTISLPKTTLYGYNNYDNFIKDFKDKEIERIIKYVKVSETDIVEIKNPS